ncbi:amidase [Chromobacterium sp. IIBBL 290-4]|uniref:amidase n=1 Tax=Chromobacterium sp. IIBBL 290-4 TaxID=2953890 RepID=UPI0020B6EB91|nr:amidase [Chromobacterium sp. IIBBL 290-4]UTH76463.1 amidase [Chromobacterium sp. IIBBL 290-4]
MFLFPEYEQLDGVGLASLIREGNMSRQEALQAALERIEAYNPLLNAVVHRLDEHARAQCTQPLPKGPLAGVPILIKDLLADIAGCPTWNGCRLFNGYIAQADTELIRRYRHAGLIFTGKTATPELGLHPYTESDMTGATYNPWDLSRTPGGSSGGSAAAVAAGMVPIAHGSDGGGSIRIPAANCGLFGLKPSRGRSPCGPTFSEIWQGLVSEHVVTRSVRDSAAMLDILIQGKDNGDAYHCPEPREQFLRQLDTPPHTLRIAFTAKPFLGGTLHDDCRAALEHSLKLLEQLGHHVEEASPELSCPEEMCRAMLVLVCGEMACLVRSAPHLLRRKADYRDFEPGSWSLACYGELLSAGEFASMRAFALQQGRIMANFHRQYDVLVTPVINQLPATIGALRLRPLEQKIARLLLGRLGLSGILKVGDPLIAASRQIMEYMGWTVPFNMSGQPAMSVPLYWNRQGLPIGTQFVAAHGQDGLLLRLARQMEELQPWFEKRPDRSGASG